VSYIAGHWSFGPFLILAIVVAVSYEVGLWRLARRSRPERTRERRLRSVWFYAGLVVLLIAVESPIDYWAYDYFFVHMIQHLLLMFAAPTLIVAGAPWTPLRAALPGRSGQRVTQGVPTDRWREGDEGTRPLRALGGLVLRPWVSVGLFNFAMVFWHLPGPLDLAESNRAVHIWLMQGSFLAAGILFWLQFIPSPPFQRRMPLISRAAALVVTNVIMISVAVSLSFFVSGSVYSVYDHIPGVTLPPLADQQLGAAILWVCGDFWAIPAMIVIIRQMLEAEGSMSSALDRILNRGAAQAGFGGPNGVRGVRGWSQPRPGVLGGARAQRPSPPDGES
jgi:putative membrane protein